MVCDGKVSVAGCLGYDVLDGKLYYETNHDQVSVAGRFFELDKALASFQHIIT
jgi:hypothetical protein